MTENLIGEIDDKPLDEVVEIIYKWMDIYGDKAVLSFEYGWDGIEGLNIIKPLSELK